MRSIATLALLCAISSGLNGQRKQDTSITLSASPNPVNPYQPITFTATVSPASATGSVSLLLGTMPIQSGLELMGGSVSFQIGMPAGTYAFVAAYGGDQNDEPSKSAVLSQVVTAQPVPGIASVQNAAAEGWPSAGSAAAIYGTFLGVATTRALGIPLPYTLGGVTVFVDGVQAPLYYVSASQINFQVPWEVVDETATINVTNGIWNLTLGTSVNSSWPGLFAPILHAANFSVVSPGSPAIGGEVVLLYGTGFGPVSNAQVDGAEASDAPLSPTQSAPQVSIGGEAASVLWSGLAPGFVGLYQINVQVPLGLQGNNDIVATVASVPSNSITLAIKR
jgi:uncharacterized protein (TIGR03437 family)